MTMPESATHTRFLRRDPVEESAMRNMAFASALESLDVDALRRRYGDADGATATADALMDAADALRAVADHIVGAERAGSRALALATSTAALAIALAATFGPDDLRRSLQSRPAMRPADLDKTANLIAAFAGTMDG